MLSDGPTAKGQGPRGQESNEMNQIACDFSVVLYSRTVERVF